MLAILCTSLLLYNMAAIPLCKQQIFVDRETISPAEIVILIGLALIPVFDLVSSLVNLNQRLMDSLICLVNFGPTATIGRRLGAVKQNIQRSHQI